MRRIDSIKKRLDAIGASSHDWSEIEIEWQSRADTLASVLTGLPSDRPNVISLEWPDEKPATDGQKIKWLRQYSREKIAEFRQEWQASTGPRARAAITELDRLEPLLDLEREESGCGRERPPQE